MGADGSLKVATDPVKRLPFKVATEPVKKFPFTVSADQMEKLGDLCRDHADARTAIGEIEAYRNSALMQEQVAHAVALDPNVGSLNGSETSYCAPWHDFNFANFSALVRLLPQGPFESVILVPFGKLGGADFVAGVLAKAVAQTSPTLILRTEASDWDRPDWYPENVAAVDLSGALAKFPNKPLALYMLMRVIAPKRIYNVNSRNCFDMFAEFGARLAVQFRIYAYYFCADHSANGDEVGYPVWYFSNLLFPI